MWLLRRFITNCSQLPQRGVPLPEVLLPLTLGKFSACQCQMKKQFSISGAQFEKIPTSLFKYELFSEDKAPAILDVEKEREKTAKEEEDVNEFEGISLKRGTTGVLDVEEVVEILRREKGQDILVVKVPPEFNYADYKVLVTGRSQRHMLAMADFMRRVYKNRLKCPSNQIPHLEGKNSKVWMAIDLGNIILHVFSAAGRQQYDLETLWTVGKDYDTITHSKDSSIADSTDYAQVLASLTPNT